MNKSELFDFFTDRVSSEQELKSVSFYLDGDVDMDSDFYDITIYNWGASMQKFGCTKLVVFFDEIEDYVIKIPFQGRAYIGYQEEEEEEEIEYDYFTQANSCVECQEWDYCEAEAMLYKEAKNFGVEQFLAKTFYLGSIGKTPIYASEKIEIELAYASDKITYSDKSFYSAKQLDSFGDSGLSLDVLSTMIDQYSQEQVSNLLRFIETYNLNDFHSSNLGFSKDGMIKIIDYSCYND